MGNVYQNYFSRGLLGDICHPNEVIEAQGMAVSSEASDTGERYIFIISYHELRTEETGIVQYSKLICSDMLQPWQLAWMGFLNLSFSHFPLYRKHAHYLSKVSIFHWLILNIQRVHTQRVVKFIFPSYYVDFYASYEVLTWH